MIEPERKVRELYDRKDSERSSMNLMSLGALITFALPLAWYFLLDRVREVSAAVAGRDRQQH